jgi:MFS family permease
VLLSGRGISAIVVTWLATMGLRRTGYRLPLFLGFVVMAAGTIAVALRPIGMSPYGWLVAAGALTGVGMGMSGPASRNAALQLAPHEASAIAGLRTTSREAGSIVGVSVTTAVVAGAANPGLTQAHVFAAFGLVLLLAMPLVLRVPDHRGSW